MFWIDFVANFPFPRSLERSNNYFCHLAPPVGDECKMHYANLSTSHLSRMRPTI